MSQFSLYVLALIQGFTEFLPVSSSAHLAVAYSFFSRYEIDPALLVVMHIGTLFSVLFVLRRDILRMTIALFTVHKYWKSGDFTLEQRQILWILLASIPTGLAGVALSPYLHYFSSNMVFIAIALVGTGAVLISTYYAPQQKQNSFNWKKAILLGILQACALFPGISRSDMTISGALWMGMPLQQAGRFSFLLSIPTVVGALFLERIPYRHMTQMLKQQDLLIGLSVSFVLGIFALRFLLYMLQSGKFWVFAFYCWVVGFSLLAYTLRLF